ncbi:MAG: pentapeptide repeat-containing protein [Myxococcota bacterium]
MRSRTVEPAPLATLREKQETARRLSLPAGRRRLASMATLTAALGFVVLTVRPVIVEMQMVVHAGAVFRMSVATLLPAAVLAWALRLLSQRRLGAQILCRAVWWSNLIVGLLIALNFPGVVERATGAVIAVACAVALRSVGERGLDAHDPDHPFAPVRFRGQLLLALIMAFADAQTLAFSALMQLRIGMMGWTLQGTVAYAGPTILAATVMGIAVWGVYRLRTWALFLNLVANIAIAYFALEGTLGLASSVSVTLATTAAIQCFLPVPILATALGDENAGRSHLGRGRGWLMQGAVIMLAAASVLVVPMPNEGDGWMTGPGRAFHRGMFDHRRSMVQESVRERLDATSNDLRGRRFEREGIHRANFDGADLRGASFAGSSVTGSTFRNAKLDGADFRGAVLTLRYGKFVTPKGAFDGSTILGADFTGADTDAGLWAAWTPDELDGVTCPDGRPADPNDGCALRLGRVAPGYRVDLRWTDASGGADCPSAGHVSRALWVPGDRLNLQHHHYIQLADGRFMGPDGTIDPSETSWTVATTGCGTMTAEVIDRVNDPDGSAP